MSALFAAGVAGAYIAGVIGLHRLNVRRMRARSGGFPALGWLDWDTLLEGLVPEQARGPAPADSTPPSPVLGGGPPPRLLRDGPWPGFEARHAILSAVAAGLSVDPSRFVDAGLSGGQVRWLETLAGVPKDPERILEHLESAKATSVAELYLREHLTLKHRTHAVNLELAVFSAKRRLTAGLARFGEHPALFFVRAQASARMGLNGAAVDDLARAVYFSRQAPFYLRAVVETPYIAEVRPSLAQLCRESLDTSG